MVKELQGISVCTFLADRRVAERQAQAAERYFENYGFKPRIKIANDFSNPLQKGSSIVLWAKTDSDVLLGGDAIGEIRKRSEVVGREAAENLMREIESEATVDVHLADMLVPYVALADGSSTYIARRNTEHLETNIWLAQKILGVHFNVTKTDKGYLVRQE